MCGIAGIIAKDAIRHEGCTRHMLRTIAHRGPDDSRVTVYPHAALGHARLSIVDLAGGAQPMLNHAGTTAVVFNGEIYGYQAIREKLTYPFTTSSDTEVILALYAARGASFVSELPGMFSFGLWDDTTGTFIAARDRFGEKPFYYAFGKQGELIFASEIKAILASGLLEPQLSKDSLAHYLSKLYVHPSKTIYSNIHTLPPAHTLTYNSGHLTVTRYWHQPTTNDTISLDEALPKFTSLLTDAVAKQLVADVPVGAFLSGGLDSTTVVSIASRLKPHIKTFSFGYEGTKNELTYARLAANAYGTDHYELRDHDYDIAELLLLMADVYDEPFADSSNISTYLISKLTKEHATVVLSGDGADELLGGYYGWYRPIIAMTDPLVTNFTGKTLLLRLIAQIALRRNWRRKTEVINRARGLYYRNNFMTAIDAHRQSNVFFKPNEISELGIIGSVVLPKPSWEPTNTVDDAMRDDIENYMPGDILVKTDRASMANSLELRAPFLDVSFAEFALSLPHRLKITNDEDKLILRRAYAAAWPEQIRTRSKQGFGAPVDIWMSKPAVAALIEGYLNDPTKKIFNYLSYTQTRKYVREKNYKLWILLTLSIWMEKHKFV